MRRHDNIIFSHMWKLRTLKNTAAPNDASTQIGILINTVLLPSGSEQHEVLQVGSILEGISQAVHQIV